MLVAASTAAHITSTRHRHFLALSRDFLLPLRFFLRRPSCVVLQVGIFLGLLAVLPRL